VTTTATTSGAPFAVQISGADCDSQYFNCPESNTQAGSNVYCGNKEEFTIDQFGYMHLGTSDVIACQQTNGFQDFRFLPVFDCIGVPFFQAVICSIQSGVLDCTGPYGDGFSTEFGQVFLGPNVDVVLQANVVAYP
jgi:hypothetical protein